MSGRSVYSYVNNNPLSRIDPSGFDDIPEIVVNCCSSSSGGFVGDIVSFFGFGGGGGSKPAPNGISRSAALPTITSSFSQNLINNAAVQAGAANYFQVNTNNFELTNVSQAPPDGTPNQVGEITVTGHTFYGTNLAPLFVGIGQYNPLHAGVQTLQVGINGALGVRGLMNLYGMATAAFAARGAGLAGSFSSVTNSVGGRVYTSVGEINQFNFRGIVNTELYNGGVSILSGVDGFANGSWIAASDLFEADVATFGGTPGVSVYNFSTMSASEVTGVLNGPGAVIGAFCNSGVCLAPYW